MIPGDFDPHSNETQCIPYEAYSYPKWEKHPKTCCEGELKANKTKIWKNVSGGDIFQLFFYLLLCRVHCCVIQPYWLKKNPLLLSYKEICFKTQKKNALVKVFSLHLKDKSFTD